MKRIIVSSAGQARGLSGIEILESRIAPASVVSLSGGNLTVIDGVNASDTINISVSGANYHFSDPFGITAGTGASQIDANNVEVAIAGVTGSFTVDTNGTSAPGDSVSFSTALSTAGNLTVDTGPGAGAISISGGLSIGGDGSFSTTGGLYVGAGAGVTTAVNRDLTVTAGGQVFIDSGSVISASGTGAISITTERNYVMGSLASISTVDGALFLSANDATSTSGGFTGVDLNGASVLVTGTGALTILAHGGNHAIGSQAGLRLSNGASILGGTSSAVTILGRGGESVGDLNHGVELDGVGSTISSLGADVSVTGNGGGSFGSKTNFGVSVSNGGRISAGGNGMTQVFGLGGGLASGGSGIGSNYGVNVNFGTIDSNNGDIFVNALAGGTGSSGSDYGLNVVAGGYISPGGNRLATISGVGGGGTGNSNYGIVVVGTGSSITASNVIGQGGGSGASGDSVGVYVLDGAGIYENGEFSLYVTGTGGVGSGIGNSGVRLSDAGTVIDGPDGDLRIFGTVGGGTGGFGIDILNGAKITSTGGSGSLRLFADSMNIAGVVDAGAGHNARIFQNTSGVAINLGGADGPGVLGLTNVELALIHGFGIAVGNSASGTITVSADLTLPGKNLSLNTNAGITGTGDIINGSASSTQISFFANANSTYGGRLGGPVTGTADDKNLSFFKGGSGVLILTGDNTFSGGTTISAGELQLGNGGTSGAIGTGPISAGRYLAVNRSETFTLAVDVSGSFGIIQRGIGTTVLSGNNTYTGLTFIQSGTLRLDSVNASLNTDVVLAGGRLAYNLGGTNTVSPRVFLAADATVSVAEGSRVNWVGNRVLGEDETGSFSLTKTGLGILSHDSAEWNVVQVNLQAGVLAATGSSAFGTDPIFVANNAAIWIDGSGITLPNALELNGDGPGFGPVGALVHNSGGGLATVTGAINLPLYTSIGTDGGDMLVSGAISGSEAGITKTGPNTLILSNTHSTFGNATPGTITIRGGVLQVASDKAFGDPANRVSFNGGDLKTTSSFTSLRYFSRDANATIDVSGTLKLLGLVDGPGIITKTGTGTLQYAAGTLGTTVVTAGVASVADTRLAVAGVGQAIVVVIDDGAGGSVIDTITLDGTNNASILTVKPLKSGTTTTVNKILSPNPDYSIGTITLAKGVTLGDGIADAIPDINIAGEISVLKLQNVNANTIIRIGYGLTYNVPGDETAPDTYNNHPNLTIAKVLGPGVVIDVTGDGTVAGTGGGGLGKVTVDTWEFPGVIRTTQSITSFTLKHGDCFVVFEVDKFHNGASTIAEMGRINIAQGSWGSVGSEIEGGVGSFQARAFLEGATLTAGSIGQLTTKTGEFAGTLTLTDVSPTLLGSFKVNSNFTGYINAVGPVKALTVKGNFTGSLVARAIGSISAYEFIGTTSEDGGIYGDPNRQNIWATDGSIGTLKATAGGIKDYEIIAKTVFNGFSIKQVSALVDTIGIDHVFVRAAEIGNSSVTLASPNGSALTGVFGSVFSSETSIGKITSSHSVVDTVAAAGTVLGAVKIGNSTVFANLTGSQLLAGVDLGMDGILGGGNDAFTRAATIAAITVTGKLGTTTIASGVMPGRSGVFGDGDDVAAPGDALAKKAIGKIVLGAESGSLQAGLAVDTRYAIEGGSFTSISIAGETTKVFSGPNILRAPDGDTAMRIV